AEPDAQWGVAPGSLVHADLGAAVEPMVFRTADLQLPALVRHRALRRDPVRAVRLADHGPLDRGVAFGRFGGVRRCRGEPDAERDRQGGDNISDHLSSRVVGARAGPALAVGDVGAGSFLDLAAGLAGRAPGHTAAVPAGGVRGGVGVGGDRALAGAHPPLVIGGPRGPHRKILATNLSELGLWCWQRCARLAALNLACSASMNARPASLRGPPSARTVAS